MNADETEVYDFLKQSPRLYISATEISKKVGNKRRFLQDRNWARPILRRMELDGIVESNAVGEYRLKEGTEDAGHFCSAIGQPGIELGDTTIISIQDVRDDIAQKRDSTAA